MLVFDRSINCFSTLEMVAQVILGIGNFGIKSYFVYTSDLLEYEGSGGVGAVF